MILMKLFTNKYTCVLCVWPFGLLLGILCWAAISIENHCILIEIWQMNPINTWKFHFIEHVTSCTTVTRTNEIEMESEIWWAKTFSSLICSYSTHQIVFGTISSKILSQFDIKPIHKWSHAKWCWAWQHKSQYIKLLTHCVDIYLLKCVCVCEMKRSWNHKPNRSN